MRRTTAIGSSLAMLVGLSEAASVKFPSEVGVSVEEMNKTCKQAGGTPGPSGTFNGDPGKLQTTPLIEHGSLDGVEFWAIDTGRFRCAGAESLFSGSGGAQVNVFAKLSDGTVKQVFSQGAFGMKVTQSGLSLSVAGTLCGQQKPTSRAEALTCDRPIVWDGVTQKMKFAPLPSATSARGTQAAVKGLDVEVLEQPSHDGLSTCGLSNVWGLKASGDGFLAVRSGPGPQFRKIAELHNQDRVLIYEQRGQWLGIAYGDLPKSDCVSNVARPARAVSTGWVAEKWIERD
jgi:hypothetical protein